MLKQEIFTQNTSEEKNQTKRVKIFFHLTKQYTS